ncbi:hypothetical protein BC567DRAFT_262533 [Phyllosticta citribraziliensis]
MSSAKRPRLSQSQPADDAAKPHSDQPLSSNHRHDTFRLGELPPELVFRVNDYLPTASSLSLAATCKGLRQLLDSKTKQALREFEVFRNFWVFSDVMLFRGPPASNEAAKTKLYESARSARDSIPEVHFVPGN